MFSSNRFENDFAGGFVKLNLNSRAFLDAKLLPQEDGMTICPLDVAVVSTFSTPD